MDTYSGLVEAFEALNERKRLDPKSLSKLEKDRWRMMRCQIEEALFQRPRDPAKDTREFLRVPVSLLVRYRLGKEMQERYIPILGEGGLFISTTEPPPLGTRLDLEVTDVGSNLSFRIKAEVVWTSQKGEPAEQGIGMRFIDLSEQQRQIVNTLVDDTVRRGLLDRRKYARIDTRLDIKLEHARRFKEAQIRDLSLGGMFVACNLPFQIGDKVRFELNVPGGFPVLKGTALVVHTTDRPAPGRQVGFGVRFVDLAAADLENLRAYLTRRVCGEVRHQKDEPRRHARLKRRIKLRYQAENSFGTTDARDISGGGVFIQSREPPPAGSKIDVTLIHPVTLQPLNISGKVVRVVPVDPKNPSAVPGIGVAFDELSEMKLHQLKRFLKDFVLLEGSDDSPKKTRSR